MNNNRVNHMRTAVKKDLVDELIKIGDVVHISLVNFLTEILNDYWNQTENKIMPPEQRFARLKNLICPLPAQLTDFVIARLANWMGIEMKDVQEGLKKRRPEEGKPG